MVINKKNSLIFIGVAVFIVIVLFFIFVLCAGNSNYSDAIVIITGILWCFSGGCYFLSEDNDRFRFLYNVSLIVSIVIPTLMFIASVVHKNNLIKF